jgi:hypothetical protein
VHRATTHFLHFHQEPIIPALPDVDPFQVNEFPKLEEFIPQQYLPRSLCVHDPDGRVSGAESTSQTETLHYRRMYPKPESEENSSQTNSRDAQRIGHLYLTRQSRIGTGHHSSAYAAAFRLPAPLEGRTTSHVAVVAKVAVPRREARDFLQHEAAIYDTFPEHLTQEFCGYALVPGVKYPVPVGAVVPKFFGYYIPEHPGYDAGNIAEPSPILLLEQCGKPVEPPSLSHDDR